MHIQFSNDEELMSYASKLLQDKIETLRNGMHRCIRAHYDWDDYYEWEKQYGHEYYNLNDPSVPQPPFEKSVWITPFLALMYCFALIDLLGALYAGNASSSAKTTKNAKLYMAKFMNYEDKSRPSDPFWKIDLLQKIFRHKLVHLAEPKYFIFFNGLTLGYELYTIPYPTHMQMDPSRKGMQIEVVPRHSFSVDGYFSISLPILVDDIENSIVGSTGYLQFLKSNADGRRRFASAVNHICDPS